MRTDKAQKSAEVKAGILVEALPYIRRWSGKTVVIKAGGETLGDEGALDSFATDVALMKFVGIDPIVIHGGGPQISETMRKLGKEPEFIAGHRVTDAETVEIVRVVLLEEINRRIVAALEAHGAKAASISGEDGEDGPMLSARRTFGPDGRDLGFVGEVERVDVKPLEGLITGGAIPVVAPIALGPDGSYNVNADLAAGAVAAAISAAKMVFLTNVPGLYRDLGDHGSLISEVGVEQLEKMLADGSLSEGMIPKISSAAASIRSGVPQAHILDGRVPHALLLEIFTDEGIGTMVTP